MGKPQLRSLDLRIGPPYRRESTKLDKIENRYNSFFVSASELEREKGIRVAPMANPILR